MFILSPAVRDTLTFLGGWPRRAAAVLCLIAAAVSALGARRGAAEATAATVVTRHAIAAGSVLGPDDLAVVGWPARAAPPGSARSAGSLVGKRVAAALPAGLPVTPDSLLEPALAAAAAAGQVTTTVRLGDAGQLAILHPGARVDLYLGADPTGLSEPGAGSATAPIVRGAQVLSVVPARSDTTPDGGPTLVIAVDATAAGHLAGHPAGSLLATLVPPP